MPEIPGCTGTFTSYEAASLVAFLGVPADQQETAIAVMWAESGGDPCAYGDNNNPAPGCHSYGLWQINVCPGREGAGPPFHGDNPSALGDPEANGQAMMARSSGGTHWSAWTTYRTGAYIAHLPMARQAVDERKAGRIPDWPSLRGHVHDDPGAVTPSSPFPNPVPSVFGLVSHVFQWLGQRHNQWRILEGAGGAVALILGVVILTRGITVPLMGAL